MSTCCPPPTTAVARACKGTADNAKALSSAPPPTCRHASERGTANNGKALLNAPAPTQHCASERGTANDAKDCCPPRCQLIVARASKGTANNATPLPLPLFAPPPLPPLSVRAIAIVAIPASTPRDPPRCPPRCQTVRAQTRPAAPPLPGGRQRRKWLPRPQSPRSPRSHLHSIPQTSARSPPS